eukprot:NODE_1083_length_1717_cov_41.694844_g959_i0.p1 GENE.NODE_1083_length_1717_cov_41.694844_g959_i0~~NODE_1083_length_1717_cov_41.694844_g959_i0.p1  ORF type:complete len:457 (-),score=65.82 NODE_1083_length_1717_cov_41.694844_g959_i0:261-1631(-)
MHIVATPSRLSERSQSASAIFSAAKPEGTAVHHQKKKLKKRSTRRQSVGMMKENRAPEPTTASAPARAAEKPTSGPLHTVKPLQPTQPLSPQRQARQPVSCSAAAVAASIARLNEHRPPSRSASVCSSIMHASNTLEPSPRYESCSPSFSPLKQPTAVPETPEQSAQLPSQAPAEAVAVTTPASSVVPNPDVTSIMHQVAEMQRTLAQMLGSKEEMAGELNHCKEKTEVLHDQLQFYQKSTECLKGDVSSMRSELQRVQREKELAERHLQREKQVNRRLSAQLQRTKRSAQSEAEEEMASSHVVKSRRLSVSVGTSPPRMNSRIPDSSMEMLQSPQPETPAALREFDTPMSPVSQMPLRSLSCTSIASSLFSSSHPHAPAVYNEPHNREKRSQYAAVLEEQIEEAKAKKKLERAESQQMVTEYFPFGRPGSGAPVRDSMSNVVTNITTRSRRASYF